MASVQEQLPGRREKERALPHPLWGLFAIRILGIVTINVRAKFEVPIFTCYGLQ